MGTISRFDRTRRAPGLGRGLGADLFAGLGELLSVLSDWLEISRQRRHLSRLDDRLLQDIGLTRADVERETDKPFWRF